MAYTVQKCKKCGKVMKIEALHFLLNLDDENVRVCEECKKKEKK